MGIQAYMFWGVALLVITSMEGVYPARHTSYPFSFDPTETFVFITGFTYPVVLSREFVNLTVCTAISFTSTNTSSIEPDAWFGLTSLTEMFFNDHKMTTLRDFYFDNLPQLQHLEMNDHPITTIENYTFKNLTSLKYLKLDTSGFSTIPLVVWDPLGDTLTTLFIIDTTIQTLITDQFNAFRVLENLEIKDAQLKTLEVDCFRGLDSLNDLKIYPHQLNEDSAKLNESNIWGHIGDTLVEMRFWGPNFTRIYSGSFVPFTALKTMDFESVKYSLEPGSFNGLDSIDILHLRGDIGPTESSVWGDIGDTLTLLSIGRTGIGAVLMNNSYSTLVSLTTLVVNGNDITSIEPGTFANLNKLSNLQLGGNSLTTFECDPFNLLPFLDTNNTRNVNLGLYDPMVCDERLLWLKKAAEFGWFVIYGFPQCVNLGFVGLANTASLPSVPGYSSPCLSLANLNTNNTDHYNCVYDEATDSLSCNCKNITIPYSFTCSELDKCVKLYNVGCEQLNPCDANPGPCMDGSTCSIANGTFQCDCGPGYRYERCLCVDIHECNENPTICPVNSQCSNTIGSYRCDCDTGYQKLNETCINIDECMDLSICPSDSQCNDTPGSYTCDCNEGFRKENQNCINIDECMENAMICPQYSQCSDTSGSYTCTCNPGFSTNNQMCININECDTDPALCTENSVCNDSIGSYTCDCNQGYKKENEYCINIDECMEDPTACPENSQCTDSVGSFECTCNLGFRKEINLCNDIIECHIRPAICPENSQCNNTIGSYTCNCNQGFTKFEMGSGDGSICIAQKPEAQNSVMLYTIPAAVVFVIGVLVGVIAMIQCIQRGTIRQNKLAKTKTDYSDLYRMSSPYERPRTMVSKMNAFGYQPFSMQ